GLGIDRAAGGLHQCALVHRAGRADGRGGHHHQRRHRPAQPAAGAAAGRRQDREQPAATEAQRPVRSPRALRSHHSSAAAGLRRAGLDSPAVGHLAAADAVFDHRSVMREHVNNPGSNLRVMSGMRPTGALHLGHYHGVLKNWLKLQNEYQCFFAVADWHALTTHYEDPQDIQKNVWDMVIDWLAVGIDPGKAVLSIQSRVPEIAELHLLMSMVTPLGWLERVPTYKEQKEKLKDRDLSTYGFLGYPLLMTADILVVNADLVPVGEDQLPHLEISRELARRFNHLFGNEPGFKERAEAAAKKLGAKQAKLYNELRRQYTEQGDESALERARVLVTESRNLTKGDQERLLGHLAGTGRTILHEPQALLTETPKVTGLDGQKMSKSYGNTISLREAPESVEKKM